MDTVVRHSPVQSAALQADSRRITTTLYDLIATMHTIVGPDEDALVVMAVDHLLQENRVKPQ